MFTPQLYPFIDTLLATVPDIICDPIIIITLFYFYLFISQSQVFGTDSIVIRFLSKELNDGDDDDDLFLNKKGSLAFMQFGERQSIR